MGSGRARAAVAGALAATVWGVSEPIDKRLLRCDYSDVAILGKLATRGPRWRLAGFAMHAANGAVFGLMYDELRRRTRWPAEPLAVGFALSEHVALYPLGRLIDAYHPARGERGLPRLTGNRRAYAQATLRHLLFGAVLGRLA
jgi:hypothetical protein